MAPLQRGIQRRGAGVTLCREASAARENMRSAIERESGTAKPAEILFVRTSAANSRAFHPATQPKAKKIVIVSRRRRTFMRGFVQNATVATAKSARYRSLAHGSARGMMIHH